MTGALKYKESEFPSQPLQKPGAKTDLAELIQMNYLGTFDLCQINKDSSKVKNQSDLLILLIRHIAQQNQQSGLCAQRILPSAWASAPSDQSLRRPHEYSLGSNSYH